MSCPRFRDANCFLLTSEKDTGVFLFARIAETNTSSSRLIVSFGFVCAKEKIDKRKKKKEKLFILLDFLFVFRLSYFVLFNKISIRKNDLRIKRGNYSFLKLNDTLDIQLTCTLVFCLILKQHYLF